MPPTNNDQCTMYLWKLRFNSTSFLDWHFGVWWKRILEFIYFYKLFFFFGANYYCVILDELDTIFALHFLWRPSFICTCPRRTSLFWAFYTFTPFEHILWSFHISSLGRPHRCLLCVYRVVSWRILAELPS